MEGTLDKICAVFAVAVCWGLLAFLRASDVLAGRRQAA